MNDARQQILLTALIVALLAIAAGATSDDTSPADPHATIRGMTISCHGIGEAWGSDEMVASMAELKAMGVNWITIHPYAGIQSNGQVGRDRQIDGLYGNDVRWLTRPIEEAHRLGLKIMIKPHIAYWGSPFSWRGDITFSSEAEWDRFFESYESWIVKVAELSKDADAFVVGTELDQTIAYETRWRSIIKSIRDKTNAPLTYSANWDQYQNVQFWDALDAIGIQAYFPLTRHADFPQTSELEAAWAKHMRTLTDYAKKFDRKIVFAELGYNRSSKAAQQPWDYKTGGEHAEEIQRRCLQAALASIADEDVVAGAFLWKWFPGDGHAGRGNFRKSSAAMRAVIADHWKQP